MRIIQTLAIGLLTAGIAAGSAQAGSVSLRGAQALPDGAVQLVVDRFERREARRALAIEEARRQALRDTRRALRRQARKQAIEDARRQARLEARREIRRELRREARIEARRAALRAERLAAERAYQRQQRRPERRLSRRTQAFGYLNGRPVTWFRGDRIPRFGLPVVDHRAYRLPTPRRGQRYVQAGRDILLVAAATGVIIDIFR
ncbi:MAG: RcnB family protein [Pseudomonadota bacterium]